MGNMYSIWYKMVCLNISVLGEAQRLKPPTLAIHHSNYLHELF